MRNASPARLVIALSIAAVLAVFLLYTSVAGGGTPSVGPRALADTTGKVALVGRVASDPKGDSYGNGLRFRLRDIEGAEKKSVTVVYTGSVPDLFRRGRDVVVTGTLVNGVFVSQRDSMITKCPSKYQGKQAS